MKTFISLVCGLAFIALCDCKSHGGWKIQAAEPKATNAPMPRAAALPHPMPGSLIHPLGARLDFLTIKDKVIRPLPTGAAFIDIVAPTELKLAPFPAGAALTLAVRNLDGFPVYLVYPTNAFLVLKQPLSGKGRYMLQVQNVAGETWVTEK